MNRKPGMKNTLLALSVSAVLLGLGSLVSTASADDDAMVRTEGGIRFVSGGVGAESIDKLTAIATDFNLKLVFALKSGDYLSNVRVVIADSTGKTLLDTTSEGPWFLVKLKPGKYRIAATAGGNEQKRQIAVTGTRPVTVDFRWISG